MHQSAHYRQHRRVVKCGRNSRFFVFGNGHLTPFERSLLPRLPFSERDLIAIDRRPIQVIHARITAALATRTRLRLERFRGLRIPWRGYGNPHARSGSGSR